MIKWHRYNYRLINNAVFSNATNGFFIILQYDLRSHFDYSARENNSMKKFFYGQKLWRQRYVFVSCIWSDLLKEAASYLALCNKGMYVEGVAVHVTYTERISKEKLICCTVTFDYRSLVQHATIDVRQFANFNNSLVSVSRGVLKKSGFRRF